MKGNVRGILSLLLSFGLLFQQISFAQVAVELNIANYLSRLGTNLTQERFRPLHLRYFSYDSLNDNFKLLLDKGDLKSLGAKELESSTRSLLNYFLIGVTLPNDAFWVNLRPDSENRIIDTALAQTDVGKIMLEADLQLKKDTAKYTSPETPEGREYWNKLYKKAEEIYGYESITIPTLTRPWIVPGEIIVREGNDNVYVYKATLKVMLEQDYLKDSAAYDFKDMRSKTLNEYSSQLIRELIIPKLTKEVNSSKRYSALRQVYYSLILSRWFKLRFAGKSGTYASLINTGNLINLTSKEPWSKTEYFKQYQKSFKDGEYNIKEPVYTPTGQVIRSYFSGGIEMGAATSSSINNRSGIINPAELSPERLSKLGVLMKGNPIGMQLSADSRSISDSGNTAYKLLLPDGGGSTSSPVNPENALVRQGELRMPDGRIIKKMTDERAEEYFRGLIDRIEKEIRNRNSDFWIAAYKALLEVIRGYQYNPKSDKYIFRRLFGRYQQSLSREAKKSGQAVTKEDLEFIKNITQAILTKHKFDFTPDITQEVIEAWHAADEHGKDALEYFVNVFLHNNPSYSLSDDWIIKVVNFYFKERIIVNSWNQSIGYPVLLVHNIPALEQVHQYYWFFKRYFSRESGTAQFTRIARAILDLVKDNKFRLLFTWDNDIKEYDSGRFDYFRLHGQRDPKMELYELARLFYSFAIDYCPEVFEVREQLVKFTK